MHNYRTCCHVQLISPQHAKQNSARILTATVAGLALWCYLLTTCECHV